jgi:hypothetical protein
MDFRSKIKQIKQLPSSISVVVVVVNILVVVFTVVRVDGSTDMADSAAVVVTGLLSVVADVVLREDFVVNFVVVIDDIFAVVVAG